MVTQDILTEGLTYALFYVVMALLLDGIWDRSLRRLAESIRSVYFIWHIICC